MRKRVPVNNTTTWVLLALAGSTALMIWALRKRNRRRQDEAALEEEHLQHTASGSGWSRWGEHAYNSPASGLGAASH